MTEDEHYSIIELDMILVSNSNDCEVWDWQMVMKSPKWYTVTDSQRISRKGNIGNKSIDKCCSKYGSKVVNNWRTWVYVENEVVYSYLTDIMAANENFNVKDWDGLLLSLIGVPTKWMIV